MKTLETYYNELFNDSKKWNYYDQKLNNPIIDNNFDLFVKQYIEASGKGDRNPLMKTLNHIKSKGHVFSVFFLGILLYENSDAIKHQINKKIKYYQRYNNSEISFPFIWFITSLFHDSGYKFEAKNKYKTIDEFFDEFNITNKLIKPRGIPKQISSSWNTYFDYKLKYIINKKLRAPDHGILAGILLYDTLVKTFEHIRTVGEKIDQNTYSYNNLYWSKKLLNIYNLCSWTILAHNIFFRKVGVDGPKEIESYNCKGLESLIIDANQAPIINLNDHPFLFLLCLVDTIEPSKFVSDCNLQLALKNFRMSFNGNDIFIKSDKTNENDKLKNILKMKNWLRINIKKEKDCIKINVA